MQLSIITINYNNAQGLQKTLASVRTQTSKEFEHIIIDGGSTDGSKEIIEEYASKAKYPTKWVSEKDKGIYNAMNKGIKMAVGEYIQILNSGDLLVNIHVVERMQNKVTELNHTDLICGNQIKPMKNGRFTRDRNFAGEEVTFYNFYRGTINHSSAWIKRSLFDKYGFYDEELRIDSDWKWYMNAITFGGLRPLYVDVDITLFDMTGISETNFYLRNKEKRDGMEAVIPERVLRDYDLYVSDIEIMKRFRRHHFYKLIRFFERCLFKFEKWTLKIGVKPQK